MLVRGYSTLRFPPIVLETFAKDPGVVCIKEKLAKQRDSLGLWDIPQNSPKACLGLTKIDKMYIFWLFALWQMQCRLVVWIFTVQRKVIGKTCLQRKDTLLN